MIQNIPSERAVLSALINEERIREKYLPELHQDLFMLTLHKQIFNFIFDCFIKKSPLTDDVIASTFIDEKDKKDVEEILLCQPPTEKTIKIHIKNLKKAYYNRQLLAKLELLKQDVLKGEEVDVFEYFEDLEIEKDEITIAKLSEIISSFERQLEEKKNEPITTGIFELDAKIVLSPGDFIVIGARPSMGKTGFMNTIALNMAKNRKKGVAIFSLEMPAEKIVARMIANIGTIPMSEINKGLISDYNKYLEAKEALSNLEDNLLILDHISDIDHIIKAIYYIKSQNPFITDYFIDHLGHIKVSKTFKSEHLKINYITKELKEIAKATGIRIWLLSQLNRGVEERSNRRPMLSDLRESGAIEEVADIVLGLYRDTYYKVKEGKLDFEPDPNDLEILILKQRDGETATVKTKFSGRYMRVGSEIPKEITPTIDKEENQKTDIEFVDMF